MRQGGMAGVECRGGDGREEKTMALRRGRSQRWGSGGGDGAAPVLGDCARVEEEEEYRLMLGVRFRLVLGLYKSWVIGQMG